MTEDEHQQVISQLESVICETRETLAAFEVTGMDEQMPEDYDKLLTILDQSVKQQREHTWAMLGLS
ncbi:hypothetical protein HNO52_12270 [Billgrantia diversa]|uniref:hypothetical protein n=1 Tax=Halomonas sp. MCCC 1A13316 TaxID=2733487 RepID=UPI0018A4B431|nr:hypothetical protein [Halomonas sp. MCCC 1A13316]QOR39203.1 hypothetical protein HNO52_12270 [Halomonas sp. MCCC 1A13316]